MHTVKLSAVRARAKRLNQPDMVSAYLGRATETTDTTVTLTDDDHAELNAMWNESRKPRQSLAATVAQGERKRAGCPECRKKRREKSRAN